MQYISFTACMCSIVSIKLYTLFLPYASNWRAANFNLLLFRCIASLHVHVIYTFKSCIDIDGSCMLLNLYSRKGWVQSGIVRTSSFQLINCVHQNCDSCSSYKLQCEHSVKVTLLILKLVPVILLLEDLLVI